MSHYQELQPSSSVRVVPAICLLSVRVRMVKGWPASSPRGKTGTIVFLITKRPSIATHPQIVPAEVGEDSGVIGAAAMAKRDVTGSI